jgi:hypothetical protein
VAVHRKWRAILAISDLIASKKTQQLYINGTLVLEQEDKIMKGIAVASNTDTWVSIQSTKNACSLVRYAADVADAADITRKETINLPNVESVGDVVTMYIPGVRYYIIAVVASDKKRIIWTRSDQTDRTDDLGVKYPIVSICTYEGVLLVLHSNGGFSRYHYQGGNGGSMERQHTNLKYDTPNVVDTPSNVTTIAISPRVVLVLDSTKVENYLVVYDERNRELVRSWAIPNFKNMVGENPRFAHNYHLSQEFSSLCVYTDNTVTNIIRMDIAANQECRIFAQARRPDARKRQRATPIF